MGENCDGCSVMYSRGIRGKKEVRSREFGDNENSEDQVVKTQGSKCPREQGVRIKAVRMKPRGLANSLHPECRSDVSGRKRALLRKRIRERVSRHYGKNGSPFM